MKKKSYNISIAKHGRRFVHIENFPVEEHRITFLFGESGIGKSLIAKALYGLLNSEELKVTINGEQYETYRAQSEVQELQKNSFFVFQEPSSHFNPLLTLRYQVQEVQAAGIPIDPILKRLWETDDRKVLDNVLNIYPKPYRPSGGEKQRLLLAMAFLKIELFLMRRYQDEKTFFVFDEPSGSLDDHFRDIFLSLLFEKFRKKKFTALLITHDYSTISAVQTYAADLWNDISYKEFSLESGGLHCEDFVPDLYMNWLEEQKTRVIPEKTFQPYQPVLRVASSLEVFGRRLEISKDKEGKKTCPLEIHPFSMTYLKAASGVGKTSFAKAIMGLVSAKNLHLQLKNVLLTETTLKKYKEEQIWGKRMVMAFQHADEALNQNSTVEGVLSGLPVKMSAENIRTMMCRLFGDNLQNIFLKTKVKYLSGGQKQKMNLLRCLVLDTDVLVLDEPFNGLDFKSIVNILSILQEKQKEGKGILIISHNEEIFDAIISPEYVYFLHAFADSSSSIDLSH
jgi:ABC-type glutathione transport system ATPase component